MHLLIFLSLLTHLPAMAGCRLATPPHTLEPATVRAVAELKTFLDHEEDETSCEQDLAEKGKAVDVWLGFFRQNLEQAGGMEAKWVNELFDRSPPTGADAACSLDEELAQAEEFYARFDRHAAEIDDRLNSVAHTLLSVRAEQAVFANKKMAIALLDCRDEYMISTASWDYSEMDENSGAEERQTCLAKTGADPELWEAVKLLARNSQGVATGLYCLLDDQHRVQAGKNLELAAGIETGAEKLLRESMKYIEETQNSAPERLRKLKQKRKALAAFKCDQRREREMLQVELRTRKLFAEEGWGSGFVLNGPKGKLELVTARHVVFDGESHESGRVKTVGVKAEKQSRYGDRFPISPGSYDRSRDLIKRDLDKPSPNFTAVKEGQLSRAGDKVTLYGYPASRDGKFTSYQCEVKGLGRNIFSTSQTESYLVHCPGAEEHIGGMSGGPVIGASGEVIGAISAHNPLTNVVIVQPISRNVKGENQFGFKQVFHYDSCFDEADISAPRPCQVIPGLTYQHSIP